MHVQGGGFKVTKSERKYFMDDPLTKETRQGQKNLTVTSCR